MDRVSLDSARTQLQVERRTIKMRLKAAVIGGDIDPEALRARVRDFVKGVFEKHGVDYKEMTPEETQERLRTDLSPEKVSERILDFVRGFVNGSAERAELLRGAVERGYEQAKEAWGGDLPEVAEQTMKLVREGLDRLFSKVDVKV